MSPWFIRFWRLVAFLSPLHRSMLLTCVFLFLADERDRVQKKTFTKWVNKHLIKVRYFFSTLTVTGVHIPAHARFRSIIQVCFIIMKTHVHRTQMWTHSCLLRLFLGFFFTATGDRKTWTLLSVVQDLIIPVGHKLLCWRLNNGVDCDIGRQVISIIKNNLRCK